jgi:predicted HicB family RNase H-like nuclease
MTTETKSAQLLVRIQPSLKAAAEKAAVADRRSLSSLVEKLLADYLRRNGYLKGAAR